MKKVIILIAAVALTGSVMASNVKWGLNTGTLGAGFDSATIYLVWDNTAGGFAYNGDVNNQTSFSIANVLDSNRASGTMDATGYYFDTVGVTLTPANMGTTAGTKPFYLVAISSDGKSLAYTAGTKSGNIQASALSVTLAWAGTDFTFVEAVPEPTSMALLALGVAAIGLRRKFIK